MSTEIHHPTEKNTGIKIIEPLQQTLEEHYGQSSATRLRETVLLPKHSHRKAHCRRFILHNEVM